MKNKIIIGAIVVLAGVLIFENAYLLGRYHKEKAHKAAYARYQPAPSERPLERNLPVFYEARSRDPFEEMNRMQERMNRVFENGFSGNLSPPDVGGHKASAGSSTSFSNTGSAYIVKVGMPGIDKNDIDIQVKGRQLMISAKNTKDKTNKDKNFYSRELSYGDFASNFMLPQDAQISRIASDYKDGVLTITIPREEKDKTGGPSAIKVPVK